MKLRCAPARASLKKLLRHSLPHGVRWVVMRSSDTPGDTWHVYTDGSTRHERRQTFSGWAARAVQRETRQFRQVSGAHPGGDSLSAERTAILEGLRLVPRGATVRLYCDLELSAILALLESPQGIEGRAHLNDVLVQSAMRNTSAHQTDMHRASRAAEHDARQGELENASLHGAVVHAWDAARADDSQFPQPRALAHALPGLSRPFQVSVVHVTYDDPADQAREARAPKATRVRATLTLELGDVTGSGRGEREALHSALEAVLTPLARHAVVHLRVPSRAHDVALSLAKDLPFVRVGTPGDET